jgi:hypothetical protein
LWAAVDYFFGGRRLGLTGKADQSQVGQMSGDRAASDRLLTGDYDWHPDPWLSYEDVFAQSGGASSDRPSHSINALLEPTVTSSTALPPALQVPLSTAKNWWGRLVERFWRRDPDATPSAIVATPESPAELATPQPQTTTLASSQRSTPKVTRDTSRSPGSLSSRLASNNGDPLVAANLAMAGADLVAHAEDAAGISNTWIEAEATSLGYVQHPLERVLGWLDRAMLWLEEVIIRLGQWFQQWWHH